MNSNILDHYRQYGTFTYPGLYEEYLKSLPNDVRELGLLLRKNFIHRTTLAAGNKGTNKDLKYGDMTQVPWWRQPEDDNLGTTAAMIAEFFRRDPKGLTLEKTVEKKLVLTCRYVAILMASVLKAKGIPTRVRSGFADYFENNRLFWDHWIIEYWSEKEDRWITIDVDASLHENGLDMYDIPKGKFQYASDVWLGIRGKKLDENQYRNAGGYKGLITVSWQLFYDFHCLMNEEIMYDHGPEFTMIQNFDKTSERTLKEVDKLASLMQDPDKNFLDLQKVWNTNKKFRLLKGGLL